MKKPQNKGSYAKIFKEKKEEEEKSKNSIMNQDKSINTLNNHNSNKSKVMQMNNKDNNISAGINFDKLADWDNMVYPDEDNINKAIKNFNNNSENINNNIPNNTHSNPILEQINENLTKNNNILQNINQNLQNPKNIGNPVNNIHTLQQQLNPAQFYKAENKALDNISINTSNFTYKNELNDKIELSVTGNDPYTIGQGLKAPSVFNENMQSQINKNEYVNPIKEESNEKDSLDDDIKNQKDIMDMMNKEIDESISIQQMNDLENDFIKNDFIVGGKDNKKNNKKTPYKVNNSDVTFNPKKNVAKINEIKVNSGVDENLLKKVNYEEKNLKNLNNNIVNTTNEKSFGNVTFKPTNINATGHFNNINDFNYDNNNDPIINVNPNPIPISNNTLPSQNIPNTVNNPQNLQMPISPNIYPYAQPFSVYPYPNQPNFYPYMMPFPQNLQNLPNMDPNFQMQIPSFAMQMQPQIINNNIVNNNISNQANSNTQNNNKEKKKITYKPKSLKEYKEKYTNKKEEHRGGLGANIGGEDWKAQKEKNAKIKEYSEKIKNFNEDKEKHFQSKLKGFKEEKLNDQLYDSLSDEEVPHKLDLKIEDKISENKGENPLKNIEKSKNPEIKTENNKNNFNRAGSASNNNNSVSYSGINYLKQRIEQKKQNEPIKTNIQNNNNEISKLKEKMERLEMDNKELKQNLKKIQNDNKNQLSQSQIIRGNRNQLSSSFGNTISSKTGSHYIGEKVKILTHKHELVYAKNKPEYFSGGNFICDECRRDGFPPNFYCKECKYDICDTCYRKLNIIITNI